MTRTWMGWLSMLLVLACAPGFAQKESAMRSVQGLVSNADESAAVGAVVQMFQERIGISRHTLDVAGCIGDGDRTSVLVIHLG